MRIPVWETNYIETQVLKLWLFEHLIPLPFAECCSNPIIINYKEHGLSFYPGFESLLCHLQPMSPLGKLFNLSLNFLICKITNFKKLSGTLWGLNKMYASYILAQEIFLPLPSPPSWEEYCFHKCGVSRGHRRSNKRMPDAFRSALQQFPLLYRLANIGLPVFSTWTYENGVSFWC